MSKTLLMILVFLGIIVLYLLVLIMATIIVTHILIKDDIDDFDYAMVANTIQFMATLTIIGEMVGKWIN